MTILFAPTKLFNDNAQTTNQSTMYMDLTLKIVEEIKKLPKNEFQVKNRDEQRRKNIS